jgi:hypothetical protein
MKRSVWFALTLGAGWCLLAGALVAADDGDGPRTLDTPEAAAAAVIEAAKANDDGALKALFGPSGGDLVQSGGDPRVAQFRSEFATRAETRLTLEDNKDGSKTMVIGRNAWPMPVPIVKTSGGWQFDIEVGREEILARRIGDNELRAIELCRTYARAQVSYASKDRDGDRVREYAQRVKSSAGSHDGLYWEAGEGEESSPLGPLVVSAGPFLKRRKRGDPVSGYYWVILTAQGKDAPGGKHSYVINGNMIAGFALVGYPATYDNTGVMTFLVSHHGVVLEKNLGPTTPDRVRAMHGYDPDASWTAVGGK